MRCEDCGTIPIPNDCWCSTTYRKPTTEREIEMFMSVILICGLPSTWDNIRESCALINSQAIYLTEKECYDATVQAYMKTLEFLVVRRLEDAVVKPQCIKVDGD